MRVKNKFSGVLLSSRMILTMLRIARLDLTLSLRSLFEPSGSPYYGDVTAVRLFCFGGVLNFVGSDVCFILETLVKNPTKNGSVSLQLCEKTLRDVSYHFKYVQKYTKK